MFVLFQFSSSYRCYSLAGNFRNIEKGNKSKSFKHLLFSICVLIALYFSVIMPPTALERLTDLNFAQPILLKLMNKEKGRFTHAAVLDFVADEGKIHIPKWVGFNKH